MCKAIPDLRYLVRTPPISFSFLYMKAVSMSLTPASRAHSTAFSISPGELCQLPNPTVGISMAESGVAVWSWAIFFLCFRFENAAACGRENLVRSPRFTRRDFYASSKHARTWRQKFRPRSHSTKIRRFTP